MAIEVLEGCFNLTMLYAKHLFKATLGRVKWSCCVVSFCITSGPSSSKAPPGLTCLATYRKIKLHHSISPKGSSNPHLRICICLGALLLLPKASYVHNVSSHNVLGRTQTWWETFEVPSVKKSLCFAIQVKSRVHIGTIWLVTFIPWHHFHHKINLCRRNCIFPIVEIWPHFF